jgi:hypothetical protein
MTPTVAEQLRGGEHAEVGRLCVLLLAPSTVAGVIPGHGRLIETFAVSGSREWTDSAPVHFVLRHVPRGATMLHGAARGLDRMAATYWVGLGGPVRDFPVSRERWREMGPRAGHLRNEHMLNQMPACLIAWHLGASPGTAGAIAYAKKLGIPTFVFRS